MNLTEYKQPVLEKKKREISKRAMILQAIIDMINLERPTKYKKGDKWVKLDKITSPIQKRAIAIKTAHLKDCDLEWIYGNGKEYRDKHGSFSKFVFGSLKKK